MRIGIYNRWIKTLGGGERDMGSFAEVLRAEHDVDLLTHETIDLDLVASRLDLNLSGVRLRVIPVHEEYRPVIAASEDYDLFINTSHHDLFRPRARRNVMRVFFPRELPQVTPRFSARTRLTRSMGFERVRWARGWHPTESHEDRPFAWTSGSAEAILRRRSPREGKQLQVILRAWRPGGVPSATVDLRINDAPLARIELPRDGTWTDWRVPLPPALARLKTLRIRLDSTTFHPRNAGYGADLRELGVAVAALRVVDSPLHDWLARSLGVGAPAEIPYWERYARGLRRALKGYDRILTISRFAQRWITERWGMQSEVLYPPLKVTSFAPGSKRPMILSVGRFFAGSHNKKHLPMIGTFRALCDAGLRGWEYHLVGGRGPRGADHREYLEEVRAAARGYPITVHLDLPFAELKELYGAAQIFWHATGFEEDENRDPDNFEHFGLTTLEAMASGCVPVVIANAGQLETVVPGESGFLWKDLGELREETLRLIGDSALLDRLSEGALRRSRDFDLGVFGRRVRQALAL